MGVYLLQNSPRCTKWRWVRLSYENYADSRQSFLQNSHPKLWNSRSSGCPVAQEEDPSDNKAGRRHLLQLLDLLPYHLSCCSVGGEHKRKGPRSGHRSDRERHGQLLPGDTFREGQPAPKHHTKVCLHSSVDSPGARTLGFVALEPLLIVDFGPQLRELPLVRYHGAPPKGASLNLWFRN